MNDPSSSGDMFSEVWMAARQTAKPFSFRLPNGLVERVEGCTETIRARGLDVTRADAMRRRGAFENRQFC
nr:hypothetical protein [Polyangiaceae bacterium]